MSEPPAGSPRPDDEYGQPPDQPQYGQPQYGQPQYGQPQYGQPQYGQPQYGQPQYGQPQYGQPQYGQPSGTGQYGPPPEGFGQYGPPGHSPAARPGSTVTALLGTRARRRPEARFGPALAGAGAALALVGGLVWSISYLASGVGVDFGSDDDFSSPSVHGGSRRFFGVGLFLVLTLAGYAVLVLRRRGPLATAGAVLSAFGLPLALGFAFLSLSDSVSSGGLPLNIDAVYLVSIVAWLVSYLLVPGARGRALYLAAAAVALPSYIAFKVAGDSAFGAGVSVASGDGFGGGSDSHTGSVAAVTLIFGLGYYLLAALLDRSGRGGAAVGLLYPAFTVTVAGIVTAASDFGQAGTGVTLVLVGVLVSAYAGRYGRRFTTWIWAAGTVLGVTLLVTRSGTDHVTIIGVLLLVIGLGLAVAAPFVSRALHEQPDVVEEATSAA